MRKLVIFGGKGIGMIASMIARDSGSHQVLGFLNDIVPVGEYIGDFASFPVLGTTEDYKKYIGDADVDFFMAYVGMKNEKIIYNKLISLAIPNDRWASLIHPKAFIPEGYCSIGNGVLCAPYSQISPDTEIGDNCILLANSFVGHNSRLDQFAHIATNGVVGGSVYVGKAVHVGSNATIREKVRVGNFSLVGAGSVVLKDVPEQSIVAGNPARLIIKK